MNFFEARKTAKGDHNVTTERHIDRLRLDLTYCRGDARIGSFTRLLHDERCWVICVAWWMSMSRCLQSSFTMPIHLFLGLPCLLVPCTYPWSASFVYLVWSIRCTWPKYCIACCMRFATSWSRPTLSHTSLCLWELLLQFSSNRTFQIPCREAAAKPSWGSVGVWAQWGREEPRSLKHFGTYWAQNWCLVAFQKAQ